MKQCRRATALLALLLVACGGAARREIASLDLDLDQHKVSWQPAVPALASVVVLAPARLETTAIHYRLLYAAGAAGSYGESRWAARPSEMMEGALNRQLAATAGGCRLRLDIDELVQVFDAPQASRSLLLARASLLTPSRDALLASRAISLEQPAPSADARGGAAAASANLQALAGELGAWLGAAVAADPGLAGRCRAA